MAPKTSTRSSTKLGWDVATEPHPEIALCPLVRATATAVGVFSVHR